jgi:hypothetical protein
LHSFAAARAPTGVCLYHRVHCMAALCNGPPAGARRGGGRSYKPIWPTGGFRGPQAGGKSRRAAPRGDEARLLWRVFGLGVEKKGAAVPWQARPKDR